MTRLQVVWPRGGPKGSHHRGFFRGFNDILWGRGPDMFLQREKSKSPIRPEQWGNWRSYHDPQAHFREEMNGALNPLLNSSRGFKRYDPHTRKYRKWFTPQDWAGDGVHGQGIGPNGYGYPRFTRSEGRKMLRRLAHGHRVDPARMGDQWTSDGPRRYRQEHDWFWREGHKYADLARQGLNPNGRANPNFRMHQEWPDDLSEWIQDEFF